MAETGAGEGRGAVYPARFARDRIGLALGRGPFCARLRATLFAWG